METGDEITTKNNCVGTTIFENNLMEHVQTFIKIHHIHRRSICRQIYIHQAKQYWIHFKSVI